MKKKPYKTIDNVPLGKWNLIVLAVKHNRLAMADKMFNEVLACIKDIPVFEVFMLKRKIRALAGLKNN